MQIRSTGRLAAFTAALTLQLVGPLAGPVHADARMIPVAINEVGINEDAASDAPDSIALSHPIEAPAIAAPAIEPRFDPIGSGMASYYGRQFAGSRTASGQRFDPGALTAAHRTLPFGSQVRVTNPVTGAAVIVTINDRGPFHGNRVIDLSEAAAGQIGIRRAGSGMVQLAVLSR